MRQSKECFSVFLLHLESRGFGLAPVVASRSDVRLAYWQDIWEFGNGLGKLLHLLHLLLFRHSQWMKSLIDVSKRRAVPWWPVALLLLLAVMAISLSQIIRQRCRNALENPKVGFVKNAWCECLKIYLLAAFLPSRSFLFQSSSGQAQYPFFFAIYFSFLSAFGTFWGRYLIFLPLGLFPEIGADEVITYLLFLVRVTKVLTRCQPLALDFGYRIIHISRLPKWSDWAQWPYPVWPSWRCCGRCCEGQWLPHCPWTQLLQQLPILLSTDVKTIPIWILTRATVWSRVKCKEMTVGHGYWSVLPITIIRHTIVQWKWFPKKDPPAVLSPFFFGDCLTIW